MLRSTYGSYAVPFSVLVAALRLGFLLEGLRRAPESRTLSDSIAPCDFSDGCDRVPNVG
jgi:hypothetical protein